MSLATATFIGGEATRPRAGWANFRPVFRRFLAHPIDPVRGDATVFGVGDEDTTRVRDISYYRESALSRLLTKEAAERARRARREALILLPLIALVIVLYALRDELFGTDVPVRIAAAILLTAIGWRVARDLGR